jgi:hypothetical protein
MKLKTPSKGDRVQIKSGNRWTPELAHQYGTVRRVEGGFFYVAFNRKYFGMNELCFLPDDFEWTNA